MFFKSKAPISNNETCANEAERYKLFIKLIDTIMRVKADFSDTLEIVNAEHCEARITVDGYHEDEYIFFRVDNSGLLQLVAGGKVVRTFQDLDAVRDWFIPKKDEAWEQAVKKMYEQR